MIEGYISGKFDHQGCDPKVKFTQGHLKISKLNNLGSRLSISTKLENMIGHNISDKFVHQGCGPKVKVTKVI